MKMKKKREEIIKLLKNNNLVKLSSAIETYKNYQKIFGWNMDGLLNENYEFRNCFRKIFKIKKIKFLLVLIKVNLRDFFKLDQKKKAVKKN